MNVCGSGFDPIVTPPTVGHCVVYNPPDKSAQEQKDLTQYLMDTIDTVRTSFRCFGLVILGDFNNLDKADLISHQVLLESR